MSDHFDEGSVEGFLHDAHYQAEMERLKGDAFRRGNDNKQQRGVSGYSTGQLSVRTASGRIDGMPMEDFLHKAHEETEQEQAIQRQDPQPDTAEKHHPRVGAVHVRGIASNTDASATDLAEPPQPLNDVQRAEAGIFLSDPMSPETPDQENISGSPSRPLAAETSDSQLDGDPVRIVTSCEGGDGSVLQAPVVVEGTISEQHDTHNKARNCSCIFLAVFAVVLLLVVAVLTGILVVIFVGGDGGGGPAPPVAPPPTPPPILPPNAQRIMPISGFLASAPPYGNMNWLVQQSTLASTILINPSVSLTMFGVRNAGVDSYFLANDGNVVSKIGTNWTAWFPQAQILVENHVFSPEFLLSPQEEFPVTFTSLAGNELTIDDEVSAFSGFGVSQGGQLAATIERENDGLATNGVVHMVVGLIFPPSLLVSVVEQLQSTPEFSVFVEFLELTGVMDALGGDGPQTVFVPTNQAFGLVSNDIQQMWRSNVTAASEMLAQHIIFGENMAMGPLYKRHLTTANGGGVAVLELSAHSDAGTLLTLDVRADPSGVTTAVVNDGEASTVGADVILSNGVVQGIDRVLGL
mmetsp:Transcript_20415/g.47235  ORF Transcript_20415/g.47235 Transcript_20415/m.47235 type:complete len:578 (-) Transcript_20415:1159-2892(-)|eukprot:CAMPEP_0116842816 /NCGR_PEP_ID=MMETSP0418-20121206/11730_1 /TAXON_ID=1158023 /ORGANISM="Astrosyne radiata, Strain 13vi08-1A" /LENGTH=577 /DNA_ID=CAMNT_0004473475 /DNA_START=31 /DNA_END=1764 /DNA_ORIENTATION=+